MKEVTYFCDLCRRVLEIEKLTAFVRTEQFGSTLLKTEAKDAADILICDTCCYVAAQQVSIARLLTGKEGPVPPSVLDPLTVREE